MDYWRTFAFMQGFKLISQAEPLSPLIRCHDLITGLIRSKSKTLTNLHTLRKMLRGAPSPSVLQNRCTSRQKLKFIVVINFITDPNVFLIDVWVNHWLNHAALFPYAWQTNKASWQFNYSTELVPCGAWEWIQMEYTRKRTFDTKFPNCKVLGKKASVLCE